MAIVHDIVNRAAQCKRMLTCPSVSLPARKRLHGEDIKHIGISREVPRSSGEHCDEYCYEAIHHRLSQMFLDGLQHIEGSLNILYATDVWAYPSALKRYLKAKSEFEAVEHFVNNGVNVNIPDFSFFEQHRMHVVRRTPWNKDRIAFTRGYFAEIVYQPITFHHDKDTSVVVDNFIFMEVANTPTTFKVTATASANISFDSDNILII